MSEWRPDGWENPSTEESLEAHGWRLDKTTLRWLKPDGDGHDLIPYDVSVERRYAYEAGADAMLAALKGKTHEETRLTGNPHIDGEWVYVEMRAADIKGWSVVFIPDAPREELALIGGHDG